MSSRARIILVAHASHAHGTITERGNYQIERLLVGLHAMTCDPSTVVTSEKDQATETATAIADKFCPGQLTRSPELTPCTGTPGTLHRVFSELDPSTLPSEKDIVVVGHEGRLSNLLTELTGQRHRPLENGDAVAVRETEPGGFAYGRSEVVARWPVVAHAEESVQTKLTSKMTSTAVLAGFVLAALVSVVIRPGPEVSWWTTFAAFALTISVGALVGALFIYDQLTMPAGFRTDGPRPGWFKWLLKREQAKTDKQWKTAYDELSKANSGTAAFEIGSLIEDSQPFSGLRMEGPAFTFMVRTHRFLVVPGLVAAALGVLAAGANESSRLALAVGAALTVMAIWYIALRPALGVD